MGRDKAKIPNATKRNDMKEFNFVTERTSQADIELFLQPDETDVITRVPDNYTKEAVAVRIGLFPSLGQARKNGWQGKLQGYSEYINIKRGLSVYMLDMEQENSINLT